MISINSESLGYRGRSSVTIPEGNLNRLRTRVASCLQIPTKTLRTPLVLYPTTSPHFTASRFVLSCRDGSRQFSLPVATIPRNSSDTSLPERLLLHISEDTLPPSRVSAPRRADRGSSPRAHGSRVPARLDFSEALPKKLSSALTPTLLLSLDPPKYHECLIPLGELNRYSRLSPPQNSTVKK